MFADDQAYSANLRKHEPAQRSADKYLLESLSIKCAIEIPPNFTMPVAKEKLGYVHVVRKNAFANVNTSLVDDERNDGE